MISKLEIYEIEKYLNRKINEIEKKCFMNIWSEHCSYKSSYKLLENFHKINKVISENVIIGPGDDAAVIKFNDDIVISIAMESHNHPSYIDPMEGAATGVGGILRDILSMGTTPKAIISVICVGNLNENKNNWLLKNIIKGTRKYSSKVGVDIINSDIYFDSSYNSNPLVNVIGIGVGKYKNITTSISKNKNNRLILYGSKTSNDGIGGASFASNKIINNTEKELIPKGNPLLEKKIIKATIEAVNKGIIQSCRDLGAAGLAGATAELGYRGNLGICIDISKVPIHNLSLKADEILLSESQERMIVEVKESETYLFYEIMDKYNIEYSDIG